MSTVRKDVKPQQKRLQRKLFSVEYRDLTPFIYKSAEFIKNFRSLFATSPLDKKIPRLDLDQII